MLILTHRGVISAAVLLDFSAVASINVVPSSWQFNIVFCLNFNSILYRISVLMSCRIIYFILKIRLLTQHVIRIRPHLVRTRQRSIHVQILISCITMFSWFSLYSTRYRCPKAHSNIFRNLKCPHIISFWPSQIAFMPGKWVSIAVILWIEIDLAALSISLI